MTPGRKPALRRSAAGAGLAAALAGAAGAALLLRAGEAWALSAIGPAAWIGLCLWAGCVLASEVACGPFMLHEPLVAATVAGMILGRPFQGAAVGLLFQLTWPGLTPMGGSLEPKAGLGAMLSVTLLALLPASWGRAALAIAVGAGIGLALLGPRIESVRRRRNEFRECALLSGPQTLREASWLARQGACDAVALGALGFALAGGLALAGLRLAGIEPSPAAAAVGPTGMASGWLGMTPVRLACFGPAWLLALLFGAGLSAGALLGFRRTRARGAVEARGDRSDAPVRGGGGAAPSRERREREEAAREAPPGAPGAGLALRLLLLQASFSDRFLQRAGFLFALGRPSAGRPGAARAELRAAMLQERPPNTHPLAAAALVGALDRVLESPGGSGGRSPLRLLHAGGSLLAQWGDALVWGGIRPVAGMLAAALLPLSLPGVLGAWVLLGLAAEVFARRRLYRWGWRAGWDLVPLRPGSIWRRLPAWSRAARLALALAVAGSLAAAWWHLGPRALWTAPVASAILGVLCGAALARRPAARGWAAALAVLIAALGEPFLS